MSITWSDHFCVCARPGTFINKRQKNVKQFPEYTGGQAHPFHDLCPSCAIVSKQTNTEWEHLLTQRGSIQQVPFVLKCWITLCRLWNCCLNPAVLSLQPANTWTYNPNRDCIASPSPLSLHVRALDLLCPDYCPAGNGHNFPNLLSVLTVYSLHGGSDAMPVENFPELWAGMSGKISAVW